MVSNFSNYTNWYSRTKLASLYLIAANNFYKMIIKAEINFKGLLLVNEKTKAIKLNKNFKNHGSKYTRIYSTAIRRTF